MKHWVTYTFTVDSARGFGSAVVETKGKVAVDLAWIDHCQKDFEERIEREHGKKSLVVILGWQSLAENATALVTAEEGDTSEKEGNQ
jgi:hypothetical protein